MTTKVLLVDDELDFLEVMRERLANRGMQVSTSTSAVEALAQLEVEHFDAVILDLKMPGMDGLEALNRIKEKRPEIQVILLTGHATVEKGVAAIKAGALDFVEKPADMESLAEKIKSAKEKKMLIVEKAGQDRIMDILKHHGY
ncbi:MAG: response regulator [Pseudomonadota bacterium]